MFKFDTRAAVTSMPSAAGVTPTFSSTSNSSPVVDADIEDQHEPLTPTLSSTAGSSSVVDVDLEDQHDQSRDLLLRSMLIRAAQMSQLRFVPKTLIFDKEAEEAFIATTSASRLQGLRCTTIGCTAFFVMNLLVHFATRSADPAQATRLFVLETHDGMAHNAGLAICVVCWSLEIFFSCMDIRGEQHSKLVYRSTNLVPTLVCFVSSSWHVACLFLERGLHYEDTLMADAHLLGISNTWLCTMVPIYMGVGDICPSHHI